MEVLYTHCCGLDVHKQSVTACLLTPGAGTRVRSEIRTFRTMTPDLLALADWLLAAGCTHVAMESTGVYWQPVWNLLEGQFALLLVNRQHIKAAPRRKSDVRDCAWLAELLLHGLVRERTAEVNRLKKTLEGANIKLASVVSSVTGVSARAMLEQLLAGEEDAAVLAGLAHGRLRPKLADLERALTG